MHILNGDPTRNTNINSEESFLIDLFQISEFTKMWEVSSDVLNFKQGKTKQDMCWQKARRKSYRIGDIPKKMICSTCRAKQNCVYHHDLQQNCCIYIYINQIWYTNSRTQTMKQDRIFFSNTVQQLMPFLDVFIVHNMLNFELQKHTITAHHSIKNYIIRSKTFHAECLTAGHLQYDHYYALPLTCPRSKKNHPRIMIHFFWDYKFTRMLHTFWHDVCYNRKHKSKVQPKTCHEHTEGEEK